ncbi:TPA: glycosyltransferase, partial [Escherichia coli]|nr:glycosyltransferase [Escherichia coli]
TPVLNIVPFKPNKAPCPLDNRIRILFSPSHTRIGGRWNDKTSANLEQALSLVAQRKDVEVIMPGKLSPSALFELRRTCHITIDEIVTGSYHQISLEGLAAGNVVINNSDYLSNSFLEMISNADSPPPFLKLNNNNIFQRLIELLESKDKIIELQSASLAYYKKFLNPSKTANRLMKIYKGEI